MNWIYVPFVVVALMDAALWALGVRWLCTGKAPRFMRRTLTSRASAFGLTVVASLGWALASMSLAPFPWRPLVVAAIENGWIYLGFTAALVGIGAGSAWCVERWYRRRIVR